VLYDGLREAYDLAAPELLAQRPPQQGAALDCFVAAYARSGDQRDTPAFRRQLSGMLTRTAEPVMDRYWALAGEVTTAAGSAAPATPTLGATHDWMRAALDAHLERAA
jgi:hypothetical protein